LFDESRANELVFVNITASLSAEEISDLAKGKLKKKVYQLVKALDGNVIDKHQFLLKQHLAHIDFLLEQINDFDEEIRKKLKPHETKFKDIQSVTGVKGISAASVITEIRVDMSKFPDEARLSS
jgi:transposase